MCFAWKRDLLGKVGGLLRGGGMAAAGFATTTWVVSAVHTTTISAQLDTTERTTSLLATLNTQCSA